ncbi:hypothetical protein BGZ59_006513 [Podila verticillata]|nr:hypothetical protein BGZ59_006513 [Podila verticillata]
MTDNCLSLFCLVDGGSVSNVFPVKLSPDDFIGDLKKLIKVEKTNDLSDVNADKLTLWHVSIPITDDNDEVPILLNDVTCDKKKKLGPAIEISEVFEVQPPKKTIHIIVQQPPPEQEQESLAMHRSFTNLQHHASLKKKIEG